MTAQQQKSLIWQAQALVCQMLNDSDIFKAANLTFLAEDRFDIQNEVTIALKKQGIAAIVMTPTLEYQGRCGYSTAWDFSNLTISIVENPQINRAKERPDAMTALDAAYAAVETLAGPLSETKNMFAPVQIRQGEDGKLIVVNAELKALLHNIADHPEPEPETPYTKFWDIYGNYEERDIVGDLTHEEVEQLANMYWRDITVLKVGEDVTELGVNFLSGADVLMSADLGDSLTSIQTRAFSGCKRLKDYAIPDSCQYLGLQAFSNTAIEHLCIDSSNLTGFGSNTFMSSMFLTDVSVNIPNCPGGNYLFQYSPNLKEAHLTCGNRNTTTIFNQAFSYCSSLTDVEISCRHLTAIDSMFQADVNLTSVNLDLADSNCTRIANAFLSCVSLPSFEIPSTVTVLDSNAFAYCSSLTSLGPTEQLTAVGANAFQRTALTSVNLDNVRTFSGNYIFSYSKLREFRYPPLYASTGGTYVFQACYDLSSIDFTDCQLTSLGNFSFISCTSLPTVTIPNTVRSLGSNCFRCCSSLTSFYAGNMLTSIAANAFANTALEQLHMEHRTQAQVRAMANYPWGIVAGSGTTVYCSDGTFTI